jgi:hypothetical protein
MRIGKFQEIWFVKMPWIKPIFNEVGVVFIMRCYIRIIIKKKEKIMVAKWDSIEKHVGKRKGSNGKWIQNVCMWKMRFFILSFLQPLSSNN